MAGLKSLAKETAIYGASSIVGRFLNYLLVPVYTIALPASSGGYGVVTNIYAWVALMLVLLTCGMETGFFRFANNGKDEPMRVYSTTLLSVGFGSLVFLALGLLFLDPIAAWLEYGEHPWYIGMMMIVVAMDAIQSIPFAYLRYKKRPIKFAALKLLFIFLNIALNLFYYVVLKGNDVGYAFLFNLICTSVVMLCMIPELRGFTYTLDRELLKRMLRYSLPLVILGVAGILNQVAGTSSFDWLGNPKTAIWFIILILFTTSIGQPIVLYVAALGNVDNSIIEAAEVDGATKFQVFWKIKWPSIMPTTLYVLVITTINTFQCFALIQLLTKGGPLNSTMTIMYQVYDTAYRLNDLGYACAIGVVLALIIAIFSAIQFKVAKTDN